MDDDDEDETPLVRKFYLNRYTPQFFEAILESDATYHIRVVCEPEVAGTVTGCVEAAHYDEHVEIDVTRQKVGGLWAGAMTCTLTGTAGSLRFART